VCKIGALSWGAKSRCATLPHLSVACECGLLLGVEAADALRLAAVADIYPPSLLICTHTVVARCWTGLWPREVVEVKPPPVLPLLSCMLPFHVVWLQHTLGSHYATACTLARRALNRAAPAATGTIKIGWYFVVSKQAFLSCPGSAARMLSRTPAQAAQLSDAGWWL
jgi:hypothetical protein